MCRSEWGCSASQGEASLNYGGSHIKVFKSRMTRAGEMAQQLRALSTLLEVVAHNHLDLTPSSGVSEDNYRVLTYNK